MTKEEWELVRDKALGLLVRKETAALMLEHQDLQADFVAKSKDARTARNAMEDDESNSSRKAFVEARDAAEEAGKLLEKKAQELAALGKIEGQIELIGKYWDRLCPQCAAAAGLPSLDEWVEDEDEALTDLALKEQRKALEKSETDFNERKAKRRAKKPE